MRPVRLPVLLALCTVCAAGVQTAGGDSPDFVRRFALDAVHYRAERNNQADSAAGDIFYGLKYFSETKSPRPFWAVLPRRAAAHLGLSALLGRGITPRTPLHAVQAEHASAPVSGWTWRPATATCSGTSRWWTPWRTRLRAGSSPACARRARRWSWTSAQTSGELSTPTRDLLLSYSHVSANFGCSRRPGPSCKHGVG
jgi:hypothetical protein